MIFQVFHIEAIFKFGIYLPCQRDITKIVFLSDSVFVCEIYLPQKYESTKFHLDRSPTQFGGTGNIERFHRENVIQRLAAISRGRFWKWSLANCSFTQDRVLDHSMRWYVPCPTRYTISGAETCQNFIEKKAEIRGEGSRDPHPVSSQALNLLDYFVWGCRQQMVGSRKRRINFKESAPGLSVSQREKLNADRKSEPAGETLEIAWTLVIIRSCLLRPSPLLPPPATRFTNHGSRLKRLQTRDAWIENTSIIIIRRKLQENSVISLELILAKFYSISDWPFFDCGITYLT